MDIFVRGVDTITYLQVLRDGLFCRQVVLEFTSSIHEWALLSWLRLLQVGFDRTPLPWVEMSITF